jgi:hypothetical protein
MPPELRAGTCASHPDPDLWEAPATDPARREAAQHLCASCPALVQCRAWSLALPAQADLDVILGGLTRSSAP